MNDSTATIVDTKTPVQQFAAIPRVGAWVAEPRFDGSSCSLSGPEKVRCAPLYRSIEI